MSLSNGRAYVAIPGPSVMPDRVLAAMHRPSPNIYAGALHDLTRDVMTGLKRVAMTGGHVAVYIGNGHAAWEAATANLFSRGDRALVPATGQFGLGWAGSLTRMGVGVDLVDFGRQAPADPARVEAALRADRDGRIRAVMVTHVDTATTIRNDIAAIRAAIDAAGHAALLVTDCIATMGCDEFRMDDWGVDVALAASQKGLMTPPGLAILWLSDRARGAADRADLNTPYWDWRPRTQPAEYWQYFCGTAPTHHLYALHEALAMIAEEGIKDVWARHERLAKGVWAAVAAWGQGGDIRLNVEDPAARGRSVTSVRIGGGGAGRLRAWTEAEAGVTLGIGLGMAEPSEPGYGDWLRIAHMGHVNAHMTLGVLGVIEAGMIALCIPHGRGAVEAAASAMLAG